MYSYNVSFCRGGETTGSVGKRQAITNNKELTKPASFDADEIGDTVNFRGRGDDKNLQLVELFLKRAYLQLY